MMTRIHERVVFECDSCGEVLEPGKREFDAALAALRGAGWRTEKIGETWHHYCDECARL